MLGWGKKIVVEELKINKRSRSNHGSMLFATEGEGNDGSDSKGFIDRAVLHGIRTRQDEGRNTVSNRKEVKKRQE